MKKRNLFAASLGNIIEWFDFSLFIYFAPIIGETFFPSTNPTHAQIAAFVVFFTGYICRPIGGVLFGFFGDTIGRAKSLRSSILMISLATFAIGLLPGEKSLGIIAPIVFTLIRVMQGISAGGEYCGVMIYLTESAPINKRGFFTSLAGSSASFGFLLATLCIILFNHMMSKPVLEAWGWRIPFIMLGFIGLAIFIFRLKLTETKVYQKLRANHQVDQQPLWVALRYAPFTLIKISALTCISSSFYIIFFGIMPAYLAKYSGISALNAYHLQTLLLFAMLFFIPLGGILGDTFGRKNMLLLTCSSMIILAIPIFYLLLSQQYLLLIFALSFATMLSSFDQGNNLAAFVENCPIDIRYSGLGFAFNVGNALFGGTTPLFVSLLILHYGPFAPAYYLMGCGLISFIAILNLLPKEQTQNQGFLTQQE